VLLRHHHVAPWFWSQDELVAEQARLERWRAAVAQPSGPPAEATLAAVRGALADDLDTPAALDAVDQWVAAQQDSPGADPAGPDLIRRTADALLGIAL
ncbi:MAG: cysteine--1-D-myo-inosityl 2-amino-2-deoxy-alpha-D-glucopyranoside ligase, partial [Actinomycetota bacterium]|nr:cysteine--1-D-myo-inosityl 2-amino-2-deoxy-alpha-D-glucopyranoside ligase [Actinomycetota bacterium]